MNLLKFIYLPIAILMGFFLYLLNLPAGWLIGSLLTGIFFGVFMPKIEFKQYSFKIVLAFLGTNISLLLMVETLKMIHHLVIPLIITIITLIIFGFFLGILLNKTTKSVDKMTAFFCTIPGGASEIIGMSGEYGADDRTVATFHTVRMTVFTISIPIIVSFLHPIGDLSVQETEHFFIEGSQIVFFLIVMGLTLFVNHFIKLPGGTLLYSIAFGFLISEFAFSVNDLHPYLAGIGQALIGAFVGIRFDKEVLKNTVKLGPIVLVIVGLLFSFTLVTAAMFMFITGQDYAISLISTVPAGAPEMSVAAVALDVNPTVVASLHIVRLIVLFLTLPLLIHIFYKLNPTMKKSSKD